MNALMRGAEMYRQTEARSRSPLELVVMLYEGALRFIGEARQADETRQLARRAMAISRTLAIIGELQSTLDLVNGGQVASELDRLYVYIQGRLLDVTAKQDRTALPEVEKLLSTLCDSWSAISSPVAVAGTAR